MKTVFESFFDIVSNPFEEASFPLDKDMEDAIKKESFQRKDYKQRIRCKGSNSEKEYEHPKNSQTLVSEKHKVETVIHAECWRCVIKEIRKDGFRVFATDTKNSFSSRIFIIKRDYFEKYTSERYEELEIEQQLDWVFKRVRSPKGQEIKKEEFNIYKKLRLPEWQLQQQVEQEMKELSFLFPDR